MVENKRRKILKPISFILFFCLITSIAFAASPSVGIIIPSSGSSQPNQAVNFTTTYLDPDGWRNIRYVYLLINTRINGRKCFFGYYNQNTNKLYLRNDANTRWLGGYSPGSRRIIENSHAKLDCSKTRVFGRRNTLIVKWNIIFKPTFSGKKILIFM